MEPLKGRGDSPAQLMQDSLVEEFCTRARELLKTARDRHSAHALADELCATFSRECTSDLVVNAARGYIEQWIDHQWGAGANVHQP